MPFTLYTECVNPLDITRARPEAGLALEKHRFAVPLPGHSDAVEVFDWDEHGRAQGLSLVGQALQDTVHLDELPQPPLHVSLAIDRELIPGDEIPPWLDGILRDVNALYLLLPRRAARPGDEESRRPLDVVNDCLGVSLELRGAGALLHLEDPSMAFQLLVRPEFRDSALLADPSQALLEAHAGGSPRAPLFRGFARGGSVAFADFHHAVSQCRWLMTSYTLETVAISLYTSEARHGEVCSRLCEYGPRRVDTLDGLPRPRGVDLPAPYLIREIEPREGGLREAERLVLWARGSLDDLSQCHALRHLVVDDSLWLDCASIARLDQLATLSMMGVKVQDFDFLLSLSHLEELRLSRLPFAGLEELGKPATLRSLDVRETSLSSLAFVRSLTRLQSLRVDHLAEPHRAVPALADHPQLHTVVFPELALEDLDFLATLRLQRFETWTSRVANIDALAGQPDLQEVRLQNSMVQDLSALAGLESLQVLWLMACPVQALSPLAQCPGLRTLDLQYCSEVDWRGLALLPSLEVLYLQHAALVEAEPLGALDRLRTLDLRGTEIRTLEPLANLEALEELVIAECAVRDLTPLLRLPALRRLVLDAEQAEYAVCDHWEVEVT